VEDNDKSMVRWGTIRERGLQAHARGIMCGVSGDELLKIARVGEFLTKQFNFLRNRNHKLLNEVSLLNAKIEHDSLLNAGRTSRLQHACRTTRKGMERMRNRLFKAETMRGEYAMQCHLMAERCLAMEQACIAYQEELTTKISAESEAG